MKQFVPCIKCLTGKLFHKINAAAELDRLITVTLKGKFSNTPLLT